MADIVIIGSGLAGYTLVRELRKLNTDIAIKVITADDGTYYSKPQLSHAFTHHKTPDQLVMFNAEQFAKKFHVDIVTHTVINAIDDVRQDGACVLACGAKPIVLPHLQQAYHVNNLVDYRQFREAITHKKHIAIMGSGLVGCEFANDLLIAGYKITVVSPDRYPLAKLIPESAGMLLKIALEKAGVTWRLGETTPVAADVVLSAVGIQPNVYLAQQAGIKTNRGIIVDSYLETTVKNVFALGDCVEFNGQILPYVAPLTIGARALAKTLLGDPTPVMYPPMPIYVKTSIYPVVVLLPPPHVVGEWKTTLENHAVKSIFYDQNHHLRGFVLTAEATTTVATILNEIM